MKLFISYFISICLVAVNFSAFAENTALIEASLERQAFVDFHFEPKGENPSSDLIAQEVSVRDEPTVVKALAKRDDVTFFTKLDDPIKGLLDGNQQAIVSADRLEDMPIFAGHPNAVKKAEAAGKRHRELHFESKGLLLAFIPAAGYAVTYYLSSGFMDAVGSGAVGYIANAIVLAFPGHWMAFAKMFGSGVKDVAVKIASRFGKQYSRETQVRLRRFGQVLAAYALNAGMMGAMIYVTGDHSIALTQAVAIFINAIYASHEFVDLKATQHLDHKTVEKSFVPKRMFVGTALEGVAQAFPEFGVVIGGVVAGAGFSFIYKEQTNYAVRMVKNTTGKVWKKGKNYFKSWLPTPANANQHDGRDVGDRRDSCNDLLGGYSEYRFN